MIDERTAAVLRAVLDETCAALSRFDSATRTCVASSLLEAVRRGSPSIEELRIVARDALHAAPAYGANEQARTERRLILRRAFTKANAGTGAKVQPDIR
ncbi:MULTISPECIES: hypothetical protein [unclassified Bradyrhizobium]